MTVIMPDRLWNIIVLAAVNWMFPSSLLLKGVLGVYSSFYGYLLYKTIKGVVLVPVLWGKLSQLVVSRSLTREEFFKADGASEAVAKKREEAFTEMEKSWKKRWPDAESMREYLKRHFSDLRFKASGFESTHPIFQEVVNKALDPLTIVARTEGCKVFDTSGEEFLDASGSYGVNCLGYTRSKEFLAAGLELAAQVGPCLGPLHPIVKENIELLLKLFGKEEVSFHMSGTEAIMSAVYQARFHSQRRVTAVFQGTYHGWWDGVMQGAGQERFVGDCLVLKEQDPNALETLRARSADIAALLVNPISGFGWKNAGTNKLATGKVDAGAKSIERFKKWLQQVREVCTECKITLIFDETWTFHLGPRGAQEVYGVEPDILVLGKSIGGGHAQGVVLGPRRLMERRDIERPMRVNFVVGTFKGNPVVMGSMNKALKWVASSDATRVFDDFKTRVEDWAADCNRTLEQKGLPIRVCASRTTWCVHYLIPSAYNFLFMYYLRDAGMITAWVGTGKMLLSIEFTKSDLDQITNILVRSAAKFKEDGWWLENAKPIGLLPFVLKPTIEYHFGWLLSLVGLRDYVCK